MSKKKILFLFIIIPHILSASTLYIANFNNRTLTSLFGGTGSVYSPGTAPTYTFVSNGAAFGNNGYSLAFTYDIASSGLAQLSLNILSSGSTNLTSNNYLSFRLMGSVANQFLQIQAVDNLGRYSYAINVRNFLPGGQVSTSYYQKVIIPLNILNAYTQFNHFQLSSVKSINFVVVTNGAGAGLTATSGTFYLDEIVIGNGTAPVYIDNFEIPNGISPYGYDLYNGGGTYNSPSGSWGVTTKYTNDRYTGNYAYYFNQFTRNTNAAGAAWAQTVLQIADYAYDIPTLIDATGCDSLSFAAKKGSLLQGVENIRINTNNGVQTTPYNIGVGSSPALTSVYQNFIIPLTSFGILRSRLTKLSQLLVVNEYNVASGYITNQIFMDEIKLVDTLPPQAPTNIRVDGIKLSNNYKFSKGNLKISATVYSNETLDKSLEAVMLEYRTNNGSWKIISFDYNTDKKDFTNVWNTVNVTGNNNIDVRISSIDSTSNRQYQTFTGCSIFDPYDSFRVTLSNVDSAGIIAFGSVSNARSPKIAQNSAGTFSYALIEYDIQSSSIWKIIVYTDNTNALANPKFKGQGNFLYGNINDGTGLIGNGGYANSNYSTPIKIWCNATNTDGTFIRAPCDHWSGAYAPLQGVPDPLYQGGETNLYWENQDLNGNGTNDNTLITFNESTYNYDANGDGDKNDTEATMGKVFEYSCWRAVTGNNRVIPGAQTPVLMDNTINPNASGKLKVYFAITDELAGEFKSNQLIFELVIQY